MKLSPRVLFVALGLGAILMLYLLLKPGRSGVQGGDTATIQRLQEELSIAKKTIRKLSSGGEAPAAVADAGGGKSCPRPKPCVCPTSGAAASTSLASTSSAVTPFEQRHADCTATQWSQHGEDWKIFERFFRNPLKKKGTYLEMGALNGVSYSNTLFYERCLGWSGVLIEGHPEACDLLYKNRPGNINICMAVCEQDGTVPFPLHHSAMAGDIGEMHPDFMKQFHAPGTADNAIQVFCGPMNKYLGLLGIRKLNFFSLDVEGSELKVLKTIDWSKLSVHVMIIEADGINPSKDQEVRDLMKEQGFEQCCEGELLNSDVFVNPNFQED